MIGRDRQNRQMLFTLADPDGRSLEDYVAGPGLQQVARLAQAEVSRPRGVQTFRVDGLPAASASATLRKGDTLADVGLAAIDAGDSTYQFIFLSPGQMGRDEARAYRATVESFRRARCGRGGALRGAADPRRAGRVRGRARRSSPIAWRSRPRRASSSRS